MQMSRKPQILVPRLVDQNNVNAQNLNAKAFLQRFRSNNAHWFVATYGAPDAGVVANPRVTVSKLLPRRAWRWHMAARYLKKVDAIFYPNKESYDEWGLRLRSVLRSRVPVIMTLEGLTGTAERERQLSDWAGHPVACFDASPNMLAATDDLYMKADHIVAISPFLADMGRRLYGDKVSMISLGVDLAKFKSSQRPKDDPPTVLCVGSVYERKRPSVFLDIAAAHPQTPCVWLGDGQLRQAMLDNAKRREIRNVSFPGACSPELIAEAMQRASVFVLPSRAEGVPKVVQEAAACGLPVVLFGHYRSPSVVHGENGFVAWTDEEMSQQVGKLLSDPVLRHRMGADGVKKSRAWSWDDLADQWEAHILDIVAKRALSA